MLSVRPGMSESEHSIDTGLIDSCPIDLQKHGQLHMEDLEGMARIAKSNCALSDERDTSR